MMNLKKLAIVAIKFRRLIAMVKDIASVAKSAGPCDPIIDDIRPAEVTKERRVIKERNSGVSGTHERRESNRK